MAHYLSKFSTACVLRHAWLILSRDMLSAAYVYTYITPNKTAWLQMWCGFNK